MNQGMDRSMTFELTLRLLFGEQADHSAGLEAHPAERREWLAKAVKEMHQLCRTLDTDPQHKKMLLSELEHLNARLDTQVEPSWELVYSLFRLNFRLLGYSDLKGEAVYSPVYQSEYDDQNRYNEDTD